LKKLQRNKVAGLDGMKVEFILDAGKLLHMPLLITFNCFLEEAHSMRSLEGAMPLNLTTTGG
jgi:hypothetical protein